MNIHMEFSHILMNLETVIILSLSASISNSIYAVSSQRNNSFWISCKMQIKSKGGIKMKEILDSIVIGGGQSGLGIRLSPSKKGITIFNIRSE